MGRVAPNKLKTILIALAVVALGTGSAAIAVVSNSPQHKVGTTLDNQQLTDIKYNGKDGVDALTLLKKHASVQTKHYSFGDLVTSINGSDGNGSKYWTFYANGKEAQVGASAYITKNSDKLEWRLQ